MNSVVKHVLTGVTLTATALVALGLAEAFEEPRTKPRTEATMAAALASSPAQGAPATVPAAGSVAYGWSAAIRHQTSYDDNRGTLVLVAPSGSIRTIGAVPDDEELFDVSNDTQRVLTARYEGGQYRITIWDTTTRQTTEFAFPVGEYASLSLEFGGEGILVGSLGKQVQSHALDGRLVRALPSEHTSFTASHDGATFYQTVGSVIVGRDARTGAVRSRWKAPAPYDTSGNCAVRQQWGPGEMAMDCREDEVGGERSYRVKVATGAVSPATPDLGFVAYPTKPKQLLQDSGSRMTITGSFDGQKVRSLAGLPAKGRRSVVAGSRGTHAYLVDSYPAGRSLRANLVRYDLATDTYVALAGSGSASGGIIAQAQTIDGHQ